MMKSRTSLCRRVRVGIGEEDCKSKLKVVSSERRLFVIRRSFVSSWLVVRGSLFVVVRDSSRRRMRLERRRPRLHECEARKSAQRLESREV
jgi:hypothetical protein